MLDRWMVVVMGILVAGCAPKGPEPNPDVQKEAVMSGDNVQGKVMKSSGEWQQCLAPEVYRVAREKGTERPFTGKYYDTKTPGTYVCAACGNPLFESVAKFDSGTGWPSFWAPEGDEAVDYKVDDSLGMRRTEVLCRRCGAHLGHVFEDGPEPTGKRYCINSVVLDLKPSKE